MVSTNLAPLGIPSAIEVDCTCGAVIMELNANQCWATGLAMHIYGSQGNGGKPRPLKVRLLGAIDCGSLHGMLMYPGLCWHLVHDGRCSAVGWGAVLRSAVHQCYDS